MKKALIALIVAVCALAQAVSSAENDAVCAVQYKIRMLLHESEQALSVSQSVLYTNRTSEALDGIMFFFPANSLRRESTLPYDNTSLEKAFPDAYSPSGAEITGVRVNGESAEWAFRGENECYLRVEASLAPGEKCEIQLEYVLLLSLNNAFLGLNATEWRLTGFYPSVCVYEDGDFCLNPLTRAGESLYSPLSDFEITLTAPADYEIACGADLVVRTDAGGGYITSALRLTNAREAALAVSRRFHVKTARSESGICVSAYGQQRSMLKKAAETAADAISVYETLFGPFPYPSFTLVSATLADGYISASGIVLADASVLRDADEIAYLAAMQYFSEGVHPNPGMEAWLIDGLSEYASLLYTLERGGEAEWRKKTDARLLPPLQITIPGGLTPASETFRFQTQAEYDTVVRFRGAAALHEVFLAVGREEFLSGVSMYLTDNAFTEPVSDDFVRAFNSVSGKDRADVIYGWLYTIGDYAGEYLDTLN